ncbi:unnamed protein product [Rhizopus microsporus]
MDNPYSVLDQEESDEYVEFIRFKNLVNDVKVKLPEPPFHEPSQDKKTFFSQLTCSSKYGYFVAACNSGFICGLNQKLYDTIYAANRGETVPLEEYFMIPVKEGGVKFLALTNDDLQLIVGLTGGLLLIYHVSDIIKSRQDATPIRSIPLSCDIISIHPNPEVYPDLLGVCVENKGCQLVQISNGQIVATIPNAVTASWSPKGKQIACGDREGVIRAFDISGALKDEIAPPTSAQGKEVRALLWVENHDFFAIYGTTDSPDAEHFPYMIHRKAESEDEKYQALGEVTPIYNSENPDNQFYLSLIRDFGPEAKAMIIVSNAVASDLAVVGQHDDGTWKTWILEESCIPSLPLSEDDYADTLPVGLTVDFSASKELPPFDASESDTPVQPLPILLFLTNEGRICAYNIYNTNLAKSGQKYSGMITAQDVFSIQPPSDKPATSTQQQPQQQTQQQPQQQQKQQQQEPAAAPFGASATPFGASTTSFGAPAATTSGFSFGAPSNAKIPSFTTMKTSAPSIKPNPSAFGAAASPAPAFGTSGFGGGTGGMAQKLSFAALAKTSTTQSKFTSPGISSSSTFGSSSGTESAPVFGNVSTLGNKATAPTPAFTTTTSYGTTPKSAFASPSAATNQQTPAPVFPSAFTAPKVSAQQVPSAFTSTIGSKYATSEVKKEETSAAPKQKVPEVPKQDIPAAPKQKAPEMYKQKVPEVPMQKVPEVFREEKPQVPKEEEKPKSYEEDLAQGFKGTTLDTKPTEPEHKTVEPPVKEKKEDLSVALETKLPAPQPVQKEKTETEKKPEPVTEKTRREPELPKQREESIEAEVNENDKPVEYKPVIIKRPISAPKSKVRFAARPKEMQQGLDEPHKTTATHPMAREFESIYLETNSAVQISSRIISDIDEEINFHKVEDVPKKADECIAYFDNENHEWKRGDMKVIDRILDELNERVPIAKSEAESVSKSLKSLETSINRLVDHAEDLVGMELKTTKEGKLDLDSTMIEKIKETSVDVQQKELLNILEDKENVFEDNMNKYEQRMEELKKELSLASVPNKPQQ